MRYYKAFEMDDGEEEAFSNRFLDNGGIEIEGLSTCLIVASVPSSVFENAHDDRSVFEDIFKEFGEAQFIYLKSFNRVLVNYGSSMSAAMAKIALHFTVFKEKELKVYFKKVIPNSSSSLQLPKPEKQFLISPPASPPVGWEPLEEPIPVINYDLLSAVASLSEKPHELHAETEDTPGIVVHGCPNPGEDICDETDYHPLDILPRQMVQTARPPLS